MSHHEPTLIDRVKHLFEQNPSREITMDEMKNAFPKNNPHTAVYGLLRQGVIKKVGTGIYSLNGDKLQEQKPDLIINDLPPSPIVEHPNRAAQMLGETIEEWAMLGRKIRPAKISEQITENTTAVICLNDLHVGEVVRDGTTGLTSYSMDIALADIEALTNKTVQLIRLESKAVAIDEIVIVLGGDIVDGDAVFDGQAYQIATPAFNQVKRIIDPMWRLAVTLLSSFRSVERLRFECVMGNHGRMAPKKSNAPKINNWDLLIYESLARYVEMGRTFNDSSSEKISVHYSMDEIHTFRVKGFAGLLKHSCPRILETPAGKSRLSGWYARHRFDFACFAHWHTNALLDFIGKPIFRLPSPVGINDLANSAALMSKPAQLLFGITKNRVPTFYYLMDFPERNIERPIPEEAE